jgi:hypothetical protein
LAGAPQHEQAWAEALAEEHMHQRELLAVLREELGTFARECASALSSLEALAGLGEVASAIAAARTSYQHAALVHELAGRVAPEHETVELYEHLGSGDVPAPLVRHAGELLRRPKRTDRELLQAVVGAAGVQARVEAIVGPAAVAALAATRPLARWVPKLAELRNGEADRGELLAAAGKDLTQVLQAAATLGAGAEATAAADASALADSLRETVGHVESAARTVKDGKLEQVLAEARERLQVDLDTLRGVHEGATEAPHEWRAARREEHAELVEEVRAKLAHVERIRGILAALLPRLQLIARALTSAQRGLALEHRLDPVHAAGIGAARMTLLLGAGSVWETTVSSRAQERTATTVRRRQPSKRVAVLAAVAVVVAAGAVAIALVGGGSSTKNAAKAVPPATRAHTTTTAPAKPKPKPAPKAKPRPRLSPVTGTFVEADRATYYVVSVSGTAGQGTPKITWRQKPPPGNASCDRFAVLSPTRAVWHHADTDGCTHIGIQHDGWVYATVTTRYWQCTQSFFGTLTRTSTSHESCRKR